MKTVNVDDKLEMLITDFYIGKVADIMKLSPPQARFTPLQAKLRVVQTQASLFLKSIVGKRRIRHRTTLKMNFQIDSKSIEDNAIQIQSRSMSDPILSAIFQK